MKIIGAFLVKDENSPDRYLDRCIQNALSLCDSVVVLDDNSTDGTPEVLEAMDRVKVTLRDDSVPWWGTNETAPRAELWNLAADAAGGVL